ncbi:MAG: tetratricopeptide repeat protein, partial [Verrucomicrobiota bacterium]
RHLAGYYAGRALMETKSYDEAARQLEPISRLTTADARTPVAAANLWLARASSRNGDYRQAATVLLAGLKKFPNTPLATDMYFDLGNALMILKEYKAAAEALGQVSKKADFSQRNEALRLRSASLHQIKDYTTSLQLADEFLKTFKNDPLAAEVLFVRAENLYLLKQDAPAVKAYQNYLAAQPGSDRAEAAQFRLAQLHYRKQDWEATLTALTPLLQKQPEGELFSQLNFMAGDCRFRLKAWEKAIEQLDLFVDRNMTAARNRTSDEPNVDGGLMQLALCNMNTGKSGAATKNLETLIEHYEDSPHLPLALAELGRLEYENGNSAAARNHLRRFMTRYESAPPGGVAG